MESAFLGDCLAWGVAGLWEQVGVAGEGLNSGGGSTGGSSADDTEGSVAVAAAVWGVATCPDGGGVISGSLP